MLGVRAHVLAFVNVLDCLDKIHLRVPVAFKRMELANIEIAVADRICYIKPVADAHK